MNLVETANGEIARAKVNLAEVEEGANGLEGRLAGNQKRQY